MTVTELNSMDTATLRAMNSTIVAIIKRRMKTTSIQAAGKLTVGQRVEWTGKLGRPVQGVVTKVKIKMVEVNAGNDGRWNVAATLLKVI